MKTSLKKRGQKLVKKFSHLSQKAEASSKQHIKENLLGRLSHIKSIKLLIFEWGLLVFALIMLAVTQAIWFGNSYSTDAFVPGGTYIEGTLGKVTSLNPLFATTNSEQTLSRLMFMNLFTVDYSGNLKPEIAELVHIGDDGRTWNIKVRDNLKWSDGEPITTEDVLFTLELIQNPAVESTYDSNLAGVKINLNENGNIRFTLPSNYVDFDSLLNIPIVPKHILADADPKTLIEHSFSTDPVSSGAFMLKAAQTNASDKEKIIYLSPNQHYFKGKPMVSSFAIHTYNTKNEIINALNNNSITATAELSSAESALITSPSIYERQTLINFGTYIFFNTSHEHIKNVDFRKAIRQGINLDKIRSLASDGTPIDFPILESQIQLKNYPAIISQDVESAKAAILAESTDPILLNIVTVNRGHLPQIAETLAEDLQSLGILTNVTAYEESQDFINTVISKRSYDILIYDIDLGSDPDIFAYYHSSQAGATGLNLSNYKNSLIDDIILAARESSNADLRVAKYESFINYWYNDVPAIGLYQLNMSYFYNKNVRTFSDDSHFTTALDRFTNVESWAVEKRTKNRTP